MYRGVVGSLLRLRPIGLLFEMEESLMTCVVGFGENNLSCMRALAALDEAYARRRVYTP